MWLEMEEKLYTYSYFKLSAKWVKMWNIFRNFSHKIVEIGYRHKYSMQNVCNDVKWEFLNWKNHFFSSEWIRSSSSSINILCLIRTR